jgi:TolB-like protein
MVLVALCFLTASYAAAQPKVAVLDAVIPPTMDSSVIVPITDTIAEALVNARRYAVLDRVSVEQVLKEREFQVSGLVQDSDIKEAGKYLGADFVVVARVSLVEDTYFICARMINVETGAVDAQASDQEEGRASVLIRIAERVGRKLATGEAVVGPWTTPVSPSRTWITTKPCPA